MPDDKQAPLNHLVDALCDLTGFLQTGGYRVTIVGGVAASLIGRPRVTKDVDILVSLDESQWPAFWENAQRHGFEPREQNALEFAGRNRVLLLRHVRSGIDLDVIFAALPLEDAIIDRSSVEQIHGLQLRIPTAEDLVVMKWLAHRQRDLPDVQGILDACPNLDVSAVRRELSGFAELITEFDVLGEFDAMLVRRRMRS